MLEPKPDHLSSMTALARFRSLLSLEFSGTQFMSQLLQLFRPREQCPLPVTGMVPGLQAALAGFVHEGFQKVAACHSLGKR